MDKTDEVACRRPEALEDTRLGGPLERDATLGTLEELLSEWIGEALEATPPDDVDTNLFEFGANSIQAHRVFCRMQEHFAIELDLERAYSDPTISGLAVLILERLEFLLHDLSDEQVGAQLSSSGP